MQQRLWVTDYIKFFEQYFSTMSGGGGDSFDTNTESKQVTHQGQKSPENSQNNDQKNALNEIEISNQDYVPSAGAILHVLRSYLYAAESNPESDFKAGYPDYTTVHPIVAVIKNASNEAAGVLCKQIQKKECVAPLEPIAKELFFAYQMLYGEVKRYLADHSNRQETPLIKASLCMKELHKQCYAYLHDFQVNESLSIKDLRNHIAGIEKSFADVFQLERKF
ncbi:MAG: hypothetical protein ACK5O9_01895 [Holosporales bacterium]|jgi:hypothetical protein